MGGVVRPRRPRWGRRVAVALAVLAVLLLVVPLVVPFPPPAGTVPPAHLAASGSRFVDVDGLRVHYEESGRGEPALLLLHGFGASTYSWREVLGPLAASGRVIAFDRPAFGLTERPVRSEWDGSNPYTPQAGAEQTLALMDVLGVERAVLVGNSAGGGVALRVALLAPDRVEALILLSPAVGGGSGLPGPARVLLDTPQGRRVGPLLVRRIAGAGDDLIREAWHDPDRVTPEILAGYRLPLRAEHWDTALFEYTLASGPSDLPERLGGIDVPALVVTGDDDRIVAVEDSEAVAAALPDAEYHVIAGCGHLPQEECPDALLDLVEPFLAGLDAPSRVR